MQHQASATRTAQGDVKRLWRTQTAIDALFTHCAVRADAETAP